MADVPPKTEMTNGEPAAAGEVAAMQERAEAAERKRDEYFSLLRQAQADYENAHQRNRRERELEQRYRSERLALDLLPALDNLERALTAAREAGDDSPLAQGVALVRDQLLAALAKHGVIPMDSLGKPFDPNYHQALTQVPAPGQPPNTVVHVAESGYLIHDRVLRPAKVVISQPS